MPTEDTNQQQQGEQNPESSSGESGSKYNPGSLEDAQKIISALEKRVGEREATIDELKKSQSGLSERLSAIEQERKRRLEEEGNWSELAKQRQAELEALKPYQERAQALESVIRESNEARVQRIPEAMRNLVPVDYPPEKLQKWLNANEAQLVNPPPPKYDAGAGTGSSPKQIQVTDADRRAVEIAKASGYDLTPEDIAKRREDQSKS